MGELLKRLFDFRHPRRRMALGQTLTGTPTRRHVEGEVVAVEALWSDRGGAEVRWRRPSMQMRNWTGGAGSQ